MVAASNTDPSNAFVEDSLNVFEEISLEHVEGSVPTVPDRTPVEFRATSIPTSLPLYGGGEAEDLQNWVILLEDRLLTYHIPQSEWLNYASMALNGSAASWYLDVRIQARLDKVVPFKSWDEFIERLSNHANVQDPAWALRHAIHALRCTAPSGVAEYIEAFRRCMNRIRDMSEIDRMFAFMNGLPDSLRNFADERARLRRFADLPAMIKAVNAKATTSMSISNNRFNDVAAPIPLSAFVSNIERPKCTHCQRTGHSVDQCYQLHPELRPIKKPRYYSTLGKGQGQ